MGTKDKSLWIPTDANMTITVSAYRDLEDGGHLSDMAYQIAAVDFPDADRRAKLEEEIRSHLWSDIENDVPGDLSDIKFSIDWNCRTIEVCEWCESPNCDGDDCDDAPEWCDGCEEYTGGVCDCVWCENHEQYNCDCDYNEERSTEKPSDEQIRSAIDQINEILTVANDNSPDVESML